MKILVLGESETSGSQTEGVSWTTVMRDRIAAETGQPVELEHTTFIPTGDRAPAVAAQRVKEHTPDIIVITVAGYVFNSPFVWLRIQRLFGQRAGRWFRGIEQAIDSTTYERGRFRSRLNRALRRSVQAIIGGDTITTPEESARVFAETFKYLARAENVQVISVVYPKRKAVLRDPKRSAEVDRYVASVRASSNKRHFLFVDSTQAFEEHPDRQQIMRSDGLHGTPVYHSLIGEYAASAYLEHARKSSSPVATG